MSRRIRVDTDFLEKQAHEVHTLCASVKAAGDALLNAIIIQTSRTEFSELRDSAKSNAFADRDLYTRTEGSLAEHADKLLHLSIAFRAVDDETITEFTGLLGASWLEQFTNLGLFPDLDGFEPFDVPQGRMALSDWVFVYEQGSDRLIRKEKYTTGCLVKNIVGTWTGPDGKEYYVVDLGNGKFGFILKELLSEPIDYSKIPNRDGTYTDGSVVADSSLPSPWGDRRWPADWYGPPGSGEKHLEDDPVQQNLCLKNMGLTDKFGNPIYLRETPNKNLCGELSVLASLGYSDISQGLSVFANDVYRGLSLLQKDQGTTKDDLVRFYQALGCDATASCGTMPSPDTLAEGLASGKKYLFGTMLDANSSSDTCGFLTDSDTHADHWVALTDVFQDSTGEVFVQIYNPYMNREEIYSWESFVATCDTPSDGGLSRFTYVEADPGTEGEG